jgi:hypothetical protein
MRYFLPRYLELIAAEDPPDYMGDFHYCLSRLGDARWREKWPDAEIEVLNRFFDQFALACLKRCDIDHLSIGGAQLAFDFRDVLTLVVTAGGDLDRLLATWDAAEVPPAVIHMAALRLHVVNEGSDPFLYSVFLENHREAAHKIGAFLMRQEVTARIKWTRFELADAHERLLSAALLR